MNNKFKIFEDGRETTYEIVKLCKNNGYNYIIYKDNDNYYASRYNVINNKIELDGIIDDNEWNFLDQELNKIYE